MSLEFRELRWAVVASQYPSLRQAAAALNIRQSTLSRALRALEYQVGAELLERTSGGTRPTAAGEEFLATARRVIADVDAAVCNLRTNSRGENGWLTIGIYASPSAGNLYATLVEQLRRFPEVRLRMIDGDQERLYSALSSQIVDVAIMTKCRQAWDGRVLPLWSERVILAVPEHHPFGGVASVRWADLVEERLLFTQRGPGIELERLFAAKLGNTAPQQWLRHDVGLDRLLSLVSAGYGGLLMLEGATGVRYNGVVYREVCDEEGPTRLNFSAYWRAANVNPAVSSFLTMLRERYPDLDARDNGPTQAPEA